MFVDYEPEDAYDASDPPARIADNLAARLLLVAAHLAQGDPVTPRLLLRLEQLADDLEHLRARLENLT
jgi:hypothetical protein